MTASAIKPFILYASRAEDLAAEEEYQAFLKYLELTPEQLIHIRCEQGPIPPLDFGAVSGIVLGGSPFNSTDEVKSAVQLRVEREVGAVIKEAVRQDFPVFGACYGIGMVGTAIGAALGRTHPEEASAIEVTLTEAGIQDPICAGLPRTFPAIVGHKENVVELPHSAVLLATGADCPVQMFRVGENVYATQFHPELTPAGFETRVRIYEDQGYFGPGELERVIAAVQGVDVSEVQRMLKNFRERYAQPLTP